MNKLKNVIKNWCSHNDFIQGNKKRKDNSIKDIHSGKG